MRHLVRSSFLLLIILLCGCLYKTDTPAYIESKYSQGFGIDKYPNGVTVGKYCRPYYYYTHYRHLCKSQRCLDEYEKEYDRNLLVKEIGREKTHELCLKQENDNQK